MSKWREVRFGDVIDLNPRVKLERGIIYPFIGIADINESNFYVNEVQTKKFTGQSGSKFHSSDTLFSRITPCLENRKIAQSILKSKDKGFGSTELLVFRAKEGKTEPNYVNYLAQTDIIVLPAINSMSGASGRQRADSNYIKKLKISVPDFNTQKKIANVLSTYDKLIENNNRRIEVLEQTAEEIYKEWFVRMRFLGYENTKFDKGIPEGWQVLKLQDFSEINYGKQLPTNKLIDKGYEVFGGNGIIGYYHEYMYEEQKILISCRGAASGEIVVSNPNSFITNNSLILNLSDELFEYMKQNLFNSNLKPYATGSAQPQITINNIKGIKFLIPNHEILSKYNNLMKEVNSKTLYLSKQNKNLKKQRDLLLPRLMNGTIQVR